MGQEFGSTAMGAQTISHVKSKIKTSKIFVVSKSKCRACQQAKALLSMVASETGDNPIIFEVDFYPQQRRNVIMKYLSTETGVTTVPQIWINGRFIGGNDDVQQLHQDGRLVSLIRMGSRKSRTFSGSSLSKYISPILRISPMKANVSEPRENVRGQNSSGRYGVSSLPYDKGTSQDVRTKLPVSRSSRSRATSFKKTGNMLENTHGGQNSFNFRVPSAKKSKTLPRTEKGKMSKSTWASDKAILSRPSIMHKPGGSGSSYAVSGWI